MGGPPARGRRRLTRSFSSHTQRRTRASSGVVFRGVTRRHVGILIAIGGVLAWVLVALADPLGLGHDGLGPKKDALLVIGAVLIVIGVIVVVRSSRPSKPLEEMRHMRG